MTSAHGLLFHSVEKLALSGIEDCLLSRSTRGEVQSQGLGAPAATDCYRDDGAVVDFCIGSRVRERYCPGGSLRALETVYEAFSPEDYRIPTRSSWGHLESGRDDGEFERVDYQTPCPLPLPMGSLFCGSLGRGRRGEVRAASRETERGMWLEKRTWKGCKLIWKRTSAIRA